MEVRIADRLELDFTLEIGGLEETITVSGGTPLLDTRSASQGQVIDEKRIELMPLSDGNPFTLTRLAAGTVYTGDLKFSRPFDNGGTSAITSNGAAGGNEFTLDGSPNMANGRRVAFTPPAGAVQEFKVETATFDAQQGHTAGATINVTMKAGTNQFRGDGYYHYRDETLAKNDFFLERAGRPKDTLEYKRFGGTFGGPVDLGFYNGRNKTFFFTAVRVAVRPVPRARPVHRADRGAAQRRLLGAAAARHPDLRPGHGAARRTARCAARRSRATSSRPTASTRWRGRS